MYKRATLGSHACRQVLMRDSLRRDEGTAPEGYTLGELLVLCRSAVPSQRTAGLMLVAELLCSARPRAEDASDSSPDGRMELRYVQLPAGLPDG